VSAAQIRFATLWRREVNRFMKIKKQTLGAPLLETFLYIMVFGAALGSRIKHLHGIDYILFVIPGLIMMAFSTNAFANNSSSILQQKFQGAIQDQLSSPASPMELLLAFSLGGFMRGLIVAGLTFVAASFLVDLPVDRPSLTILEIGRSVRGGGWGLGEGRPGESEDEQDAETTRRPGSRDHEPI